MAPKWNTQWEFLGRNETSCRLEQNTLFQWEGENLVNENGLVLGINSKSMVIIMDDNAMCGVNHFFGG